MSNRGQTWVLGEKERHAVVALPREKRLEYLVKKAADWKTVWGLADLRSDDLFLLEDEDSMKYLPIWPHPEYALLMATGEWERAEPRPVSTQDLLAHWIPDLARDRILISAFPTTRDPGQPIRPEAMATHLERELALYES